MPWKAFSSSPLRIFNSPIMLSDSPDILLKWSSYGASFFFPIDSRDAMEFRDAANIDDMADADPPPGVAEELFSFDIYSSRSII